MNLGELSIQKKTITLVLAVGAIAAGLKSYNELGRLEDPEFTIKEAVIFTPYPGASAQEVQDEVTNEIEKAAQELGQLQRVESWSYRDLSIVKAKIKDKYTSDDLPQVWDELRRKINDKQSGLPPGAGPSIVNDDFGDVYGVYFAITGDGYTYREIKDFVNLLRRELLLVKDVKRVTLWGTRPEAIYVEMQRDQMARLGITQKQIYEALAAKNLVADAGHVGVGSDWLPIQPTGDIKSAEALADLLISEPGAPQLIYLGDVAEIRRAY
ncbi:MAG: efflux RND transporter permease subunit, partial [Phycisphaerales bacterium]